MDRMMSLWLTASEVDGKLYFRANVSDTAQGLDPCMGKQKAEVVVTEPSCCLSCWTVEVAEFFVAMMDNPEWKITHGSECEGKEQVIPHA